MRHAILVVVHFWVFAGRVFLSVLCDLLSRPVPHILTYNLIKFTTRHRADINSPVLQISKSKLREVK